MSVKDRTFMMPQAEALYNLQEVDLDILRRRKRLDEIAEALGDDVAISEARARVEAANKTLVPLRSKVRDLELEMQSNIQKAKAAEERLYGGKVKNPKELQDLQQEIASLRRRNDDLETQTLELMMQVEEADEVLAERSSSLQALMAGAQTEHIELMQEQSQLEAEIEELKVKRQEALQMVTPESLELYKSLRKRKANQPIARLEGNSCGICGIEQTMNVVQEARRRQDLVECINCGRILVDL